MSKEKRTEKPKGPIAAGEKVKWISQAAGSAVEKRGIVKRYLPSQKFRSLYEVEVTHIGGKPLRQSKFYTPLAGVLEKQNPRAKRAPAS